MDPGDVAVTMQDCKNAGRIAAAVFAATLPMLAGATGGQDVIDTESLAVAQAIEPGRAVLHLEFTPRGEAVWISARDDNRVVVYDTSTLGPLATLAVESPSGIFFTARAARIGF